MDERGALREQEDDQLGDLLGVTEAARRVQGDQRVVRVLVHVLQERGLDEPRADRVHADALGRVLGGGRLRQAHDAVLGGDIRGEPAKPTEPRIEATFTMAPPPAASRAGSSWRIE